MSKHPPKPSLPDGWIEYPSKTYPNRIYFFNIHTGQSSWINPLEILKKHSEKRIESASSLSSSSTSRELLSISTSRKSLESSSSVSSSSTSRDLTSSSTSSESEVSQGLHSRIHESKLLNCNASKNCKLDKAVENVKQGCESLTKNTNSQKPKKRKWRKPNISESSSELKLKRNFESEVSSPILSGCESTIAPNKTELNNMTTPISNRIRLQPCRRNNRCDSNETSSSSNAIPPSKVYDTCKSSSDSSNTLNNINIPKIVRYCKQNNRYNPFGKTSTSNTQPVFKISDGRKSHQPANDRLDALRRKLKVDTKNEGNKNKHKRILSENSVTQERFKNDLKFLVQHTLELQSNSEKDDISSLAVEVQHPQLLEAMDWEPIDEETIIHNIQQLRNDLLENRVIPDEDQLSELKMNTHSYSFENNNMPSQWLVVIDTNVILQNLKLIEELRDLPREGFISVTCIIPWQVLVELDHMKKRPSDPSISSKARYAIDFLYSCFKVDHPRIRGEPPTEMASNGLDITVEPDHQILNCCLNIYKRTQSVILLSNDKNLRNKALVSNIQAYSIPEFMELLHNSRSSPRRLNAENNLSTPGIPHNIHGNKFSVADTALCSFKSTLKDFLSELIEREMVEVYGANWTKIIWRKPPWNLEDNFDNILKHWIAVFGMIFSEIAKHHLQNLSTFFGRRGVSSGYNKVIDEIKEALKVALKFCSLVPENYISLAKKCSDKLQAVLQSLETNSQKPVATSQPDVDPQMSAVYLEFQKIWTCVYNFCGELQDFMGIPHYMNYSKSGELLSEDEMKDKLSEITYRLQPLTRTMNEILMISDPTELSVDHSAVKNLYMYMTSFFPDSPDFEPTFSHEDLLCFCTAGRECFKTGLAQLREMQTILSKGIMSFIPDAN